VSGAGVPGNMRVFTVTPRPVKAYALLIFGLSSGVRPPIRVWYCDRSQCLALLGEPSHCASRRARRSTSRATASRAEPT
jgi:hypothetical protein